MKKLIFLTFLVCIGISVCAQTKDRISVEVNYGLNGNFFVRGYNENVRPPAKAFYKKNFLGTIGGLEIKYNLSPYSSLNLGYAKSMNKREVSFDNGSNVLIKYFDIHHINHFFQLSFERSLTKKLCNIRWQGGIYYIRSIQQEVDVSPSGALFLQRDFKNNGLEEAGVFIGAHYLKSIDTKFDIGVRTRAYYTVSTASFEAIALTPTLTYHFK